MKLIFLRTLYQPLMRVAHYFNWHYAPPIYPDGDTVLRCAWCGFTQKVKSNPPRIAEAIERFLPATSEHPAIFRSGSKLVAGRTPEALCEKMKYGSDREYQARSF